MDFAFSAESESGNKQFMQGLNNLGLLRFIGLA